MKATHVLFLSCLWLAVVPGGMHWGCSAPEGRSPDARREGPDAAEVDRALYLLHRGRASEAQALAGPVREDPGNASAEQKSTEVKSLLVQAALMEEEKQPEKAEELLARACDRLSEIPGQQEARKIYILIHRARILAGMDRFRKAEDCLSTAQDLSRKLGDRGARLQTLIIRERDKLLRSTGRYEGELRNAISQYERNQGPDHLSVARGLYRLAMLQEEQGNYEEAERNYLRSLDVHKGILGPMHPVNATLLTHLAAMSRTRKQYGKAKDYLMESLRIYDDTLEQTGPERIRALKAMSQRTQVDITPLAESLIRFDETNFGPEHPNTARSLRYFALLCESNGQNDKAEAMLRRALRIYLLSYPPTHEEVLFVRKRLAANLYSQGKTDGAISMARETLAEEQRQYEACRPSVMTSLYSLSNFLAGAGQLGEAETRLGEVLHCVDTREDPSPQLRERLDQEISEIRRKQGKETGAGSAAARFSKEHDAKHDSRPKPRCPRGGTKPQEGSS